MLLFDAHLDLSLNALHLNRNLALSLQDLNMAEAGLDDIACRGKATVTFGEMHRGEVYACLATLLCRYKPEVRNIKRSSLDYACRHAVKGVALGQLAYYESLVQAGELAFVRTSGELIKAKSNLGGPIAFILAMEGADPILSPEELEEWWDRGLRVLGLSHYGVHPYAFGTGSEGDLPECGRELLTEMERLGMILDTTHLSDRCFEQALDHFSGPTLASHCNCRTLVPDQRQLSDDQIRRLLERSGMVCCAADSWMLSPGYQRPKPSFLRQPGDPESWKDLQRTPRCEIPIDRIADHLDYVCQMAGDSLHAAFGSDLDGGYGTEQCPEGLDSIADLQKIGGILASRGYAERDIANIFHGNLQGFFEKHLPA